MAGCGGNNLFRKTFIMMWKNFLLRKRHYIQTAFEIILPTLLFVILVAIHSTGDSQSSNGTNVIEADIPSEMPYPVDYCTSLKNMLESEKDNDGDEDKQRLTVLGREIYYTNVPGDEDIDKAPDSMLAHDIMETVQKTVNNFLLPCCTLISPNVSLDLTNNGILSKYFLICK